MKYFILILSVCLFSFIPVAESSFIDSNGPSLAAQEQSNWEFGLGFNLGYSSTRGLIISVNPSVQYFVLPQLSLGGFIQYYASDDFSYISAGPSGTYFIYSSSNYALILNQKVRFREYIKPDDFNASKTTSMTTLAADWRIGSGLSMRAGIGYKRSLDDKSLVFGEDKQDEWIFPTLGFAYYL